MLGQPLNKQDADKLVELAWQQVKETFHQNTTSSRNHSWEDSTEQSLSMLEEYFWGSASRFSMILSRISEHTSPGGLVLDAGAGHGILAISAKHAGFQAFASDLHQGLSAFDEAGIPYKEWHLEGDTAPFKDNHFDTVVLSQTIEHFTYSPKHPLEEIIRITRPGGAIMIDAPNIACFHNISRLIRGKSLHWSMETNYLEQVPEIHKGIPYFDRHNHEYAKEDLLAIANYFHLSVEELNYYSSYNQKKRGVPAVLASRFRDCIKHWRKGIYAIYRTPE